MQFDYSNRCYEAVGHGEVLQVSIEDKFAAEEELQEQGLTDEEIDAKLSDIDYWFS